jgi:hypothetical protein
MRPSMAILAVAVVTIVLAALGCCKYDEECCTTATERKVEHTIAITENMGDCGGPAVTCVCPIPKKIIVRAGDEVYFVNTTDYKVKIHPSLDGAFTVPGDIEIAAKGTVTRTIVDPIPDGLKPGIATDLIVDDPGTLCVGYPGPGVDFDDD